MRPRGARSLRGLDLAAGGLAVRVTQRDRQRIRLVERHVALHAEDHPDHVLYLFLFGAAVADQPLLDRRRVYSKTGSSRVTTAVIAAPRACPSLIAVALRDIADLLDRDLLRPPLVEQFADAAEDLAQAIRELAGGRTDAPGCRWRLRTPSDSIRPKPVTRSRIDSQHPGHAAQPSICSMISGAMSALL